MAETEVVIYPLWRIIGTQWLKEAILKMKKKMMKVQQALEKQKWSLQSGTQRFPDSFWLCHCHQYMLTLFCVAASSWVLSRLCWRARWWFEFWKGWYSLYYWHGVCVCAINMSLLGTINLTCFGRREDGWWVAENSDGQQGLVPSNYLKVVSMLVLNFGE